MDEVFRFFVIGVLAVIFSYAVVRGISFAYFRSKREHFFKVLRHMRQAMKEEGDK